MADLSRSLQACLQSGQLALLAILVSFGIVLQILACAVYNNWWPMLTVIMYVMLPMPLMFFTGSDTSILTSGGGRWSSLSIFFFPFPFDSAGTFEVEPIAEVPKLFRVGGWIDFTKFLTGASAVGSVAIPAILKHAGIICWGALAMELASYVVFIMAITFYMMMSNEDDYYSMF